MGTGNGGMTEQATRFLILFDSSLSPDKSTTDKTSAKVEPGFRASPGPSEKASFTTQRQTFVGYNTILAKRSKRHTLTFSRYTALWQAAYIVKRIAPPACALRPAPTIVLAASAASEENFEPEMVDFEHDFASIADASCLHSGSPPLQISRK